MYDPDEPGHIATPQEAVQEFARNIGGEYPDRAWLLHDWDVWVANPHYAGPPVPHPESYDPDDEGSTSLPAPRPAKDTDDIPF